MIKKSFSVNIIYAAVLFYPMSGLLDGRSLLRDQCSHNVASGKTQFRSLRFVAAAKFLEQEMPKSQALQVSIC